VNVTTITAKVFVSRRVPEAALQLLGKSLSKRIPESDGSEIDDDQRRNPRIQSTNDVGDSQIGEPVNNKGDAPISLTPKLESVHRFSEKLL